MLSGRKLIYVLCLALAGCSTMDERSPQSSIATSAGEENAVAPNSSPATRRATALPSWSNPAPLAAPVNSSAPSVAVVREPRPAQVLPPGAAEIRADSGVVVTPLVPQPRNSAKVVAGTPAPRVSQPTPPVPPVVAEPVPIPESPAPVLLASIPTPGPKASSLPEPDRAVRSGPGTNSPAPRSPGRPAPKQPAPPVDSWVTLSSWSRTVGMSLTRRPTSEPTSTYVLTAPNGTMVLRMGSQTVLWNGLECYLGFAPQMVDGHPCVHLLDAQKNIEPLLHEPGCLAKRNPVVVIDPGHGGTDSGSKSMADGRLEKEFTLDWAKRLQAQLMNHGWTVLLTRDADLNLGLTNRVAFAEEHKADLFISLHFNSASPDQVQAGLETYCLTPTGMPSTLTRGFKDLPAMVFPNNGFDSQNLEFAVRLHRSLLRVNGNLDRGVRRARFLTVLQGQARPALLVEGGYLSNPREARKIADPKYRQKLAEALAAALLENAVPAVSMATPAASPLSSGASGTKVN